MINSLPFTISLLALALASAAAASPAIAEVNPFLIERVSFVDLNLGGQAGIATLHARIRSAAGRVCVSYGVQSLAEQLSEKRYYRSAIANASGQIDGIVEARSAGTMLAIALSARTGP